MAPTTIGYASSGTITLLVKANQTSATFTITALEEAAQAKFVAEGNEQIVATIIDAPSTQAAKYSHTQTDATDAESGTRIDNTVDDGAVGTIMDSSPVSMKTLTGDMSLQVGPVTGSRDSSSNESNTTNGNGVNHGQLYKSEGGIVTTNNSDYILIGYQQNSTPEDGYGDISVYPANGGHNTATDGNSQFTTVDLGAGNDYLKIKGNQAAGTRVYLGEGNDIYVIGGDMKGSGSVFPEYRDQELGSALSTPFIFAEGGDDTIVVEGYVGASARIYAGSGSDTVKVGQIGTSGGPGQIDLGSGVALSTNPTVYQMTYNDGKTALGSEEGRLNADKASDKNSLTVTGYVTGTIQDNSYIEGGLGDDTVTVGEYVNSTSVKLGDGANSLAVGQYINNSSYLGGSGSDTVKVNQYVDSTSINLGDGTNSLTVDQYLRGNSSYLGGSGSDTIVINGTASYSSDVLRNSSITTGSGADRLTVKGQVYSSTIDMGADNDIVTITSRMFGSSTVQLGSGMDKAYINELSGGNVYTGTSTTNEDNSADNVYIDTISGGNLYLGAGDTLNNVAGTGYTSMSSGLITYSDAADTLTLSSLTGGDVIMGNGNDTLTVNSNITNGNIDMGAGNDTFALNGNMSGNNQLVTGGAGSDTLLFAGTTAHTISLNATRHIENFDLTNGHSGDVLTIDNRSLSNISTIAQNLDGNIIKVNGDVGDTVQFNNGAIPQFRSVSSDLAGYHEYTYTNSGTTYLLYIDTDMTII